MACISCGRGFHDECEMGCEECHPVDKRVKSLTNVGVQPQRGDGKGRPVKNPDQINDPFSTGRKRAAMLYPIFPDKPCDWQGKKNCGGGKHPIIGCIDGKQSDRHHGPIKNPLRNDPLNVHRICDHCHNHWHVLNDPDYEEDVNEGLPHNPEPATELELIVAAAEWKVK